MAPLHENRVFRGPRSLKRDRHQRFSTGKSHSEDDLLWCEICLDGHALYRSPLALACRFKAPFGELGLSGNLWLMEKGELDTYKRLYQSGRISLLMLVALAGLSFTKYLRRVIIVFFSN